MADLRIRAGTAAAAGSVLGLAAARWIPRVVAVPPLPLRRLCLSWPSGLNQEERRGEDGEKEIERREERRKRGEERRKRDREERKRGKILSG